MGKKINAFSLRLGINKNWRSLWFAEKEMYTNSVIEDVKIRKLITSRIRRAGLADIIIRRTPNMIEIEAYVARPGVAIGRGGEDIDSLKNDLRKLTKKKNVELKIREINNPDLSARVVARAIADGIEKRQPPKLLMINFKRKDMSAGAKGVKIQVGGRIGGATQARILKMGAGSVPLQTIKADIDYAEEVAHSLEAGLFGVKVWINKGLYKEVSDDNKK